MNKKNKEIKLSMAVIVYLSSIKTPIKNKSIIEDKGVSNES